MCEIVSFEIAKKLKEKGFNAECYGHYFNGEFYTDMPPKHYQRDKYVSAPFISQVLKWLREEHQIHIFVDITSAGWFPKVSIKVKRDDTRYWFSKALIESDFFDTYEEAVVAGIEYVLDNNLI